jgi:hypothetical protein
MTSEPIEIIVARLDERTRSTADDVSEIKTTMATRGDQEHVDRRIAELVGAIATVEASNRAAVEKEKLAREAAIEKEQAARAAAVAKEERERKADVQALKDRQQLIEDRQENRKYTLAIAILLAGVGSLFGVFATLAQAGILGGGP